MRGLGRTRNHRRNNCGSCESITFAHYTLTMSMTDQEKTLFVQNSPNLILSETFTNIDNKTKHVYGFKDGSLLAYEEGIGFHIIDTFLRKSRRRLAK